MEARCYCDSDNFKTVEFLYSQSASILLVIGETIILIQFPFLHDNTPLFRSILSVGSVLIILDVALLLSSIIFLALC